MSWSTVAPYIAFNEGDWGGITEGGVSAIDGTGQTAVLNTLESMYNNNTTGNFRAILDD